MADFAAFTIVAHNYLPFARVLALSFLDHHPESDFYVVVIDHPVKAQLIRDERFTVIPITEVEFGDEGFANMAMIYDVIEFATSVKPFAMRTLLRRHECVLYLDPDIKVYAPLDPIVEATLAAGWSLTPHCLAPITGQAGSSPSEQHIMQSGIYNLGYIGATRSAGPFLEWWSERLRRHAVIDPENQLFTDQRWIDLAVPVFHPHIEQSPAYNVAYWNVDQRELSRSGNTITVNGEPLRFFHFSGYDPEVPYWLSKYSRTPRVVLSDNQVLSDMCAAYAVELLAERGSTGAGYEYGWSEAFPAVPLSHGIRRMFRDELVEAEANETAAPPTPFSPGGTARFREWLTAIPEESSLQLPRYLAAVYQERPDLQEHFPEVRKGNNEAFVTWARGMGSQQHPVIGFLGGQVPEEIDEFHKAIDMGRSPDGIDLVGYLHAELGIGEAGRLAATALAAVDVPVSTIAFRRTASRQRHPFETSGIAQHDVALVAINADQIAVAKNEFGARFFADRYVIGQWFWELEEFPRDQHNAYAEVDEIWAPTQHVRKALAKHAPRSVQVRHMPLPLVAPPVAPGVDKSSFGLGDRYAFLFAFDLMSVFERKNPLAVVSAFTTAFAPSEGPVLVIKAINGDRHQKAMERLRWACRGRSDILVIDQYLEHDMSGALANACDCYVSLHRSEGLGLTMSEAMALGKPVIATDYSGNLDFMTDETAILVPWRPVRVGDNAAPYAASASWADPDIAAAAAAMRRVAAEPELGVRLGAAARTYLETRFSPTVTGERMKQRLSEIRRTRNA